MRASSFTSLFLTLRQIMAVSKAAICLLTLAVLRCDAQDSQALNFAYDGGYSNGYSGTLGWQFTVNQNLSVTALGLYNAGLTITDTHQVGIFDAAGSLIASGTVGPTSSDTVSGYFDYSAITPVTLIAGNTYTAAALLTASDYFYYAPSAIYTDSRISYQLSAYQALGGDALVNPDSFDFTNGFGYFGPNFLISNSDPLPGAPTPEPGALAMAAGLLCGGGVFLRRRRNRVMDHS